VVNFNRQITVAISKEDKEYIEDKFPGKSFAERIHNFIEDSRVADDFRKRNYGRSNIEVWSEELNEELDKGNSVVYTTWDKIFKKIDAMKKVNNANR